MTNQGQANEEAAVKPNHRLALAIKTGYSFIQQQQQHDDRRSRLDAVLLR